MYKQQAGLWRFNTALSGLVLLLTLSACYTVTMDARWADGPISMTNKPQGKILKHFQVQSTSHHLIFGLIEFAKPDIAGEIMKEVRAAGGIGAVNVTFKTEFGALDWILNWISAGIYNPMTVTAEGDVIASD